MLIEIMNFREMIQVLQYMDAIMKKIRQVNLESKNMVSKFAGRIVNVKGCEYSNNSEKICFVLRCQSVCMMLSLYKGFGLVSWEAISSEILLIISENSGSLYEFLFKKRLNLKVCSLNISGNSGKREDRKDIKCVERLLRMIKENIEAYKKNAVELRNTLINEGYTWKKTASTFVKAMGIETKEKSEVRKRVHVTRELINSTPSTEVSSGLQ